MSTEKRARELLAQTRSPFDETDCFSDTLWPQEIDALAKAIAALCAEIEQETVERCATAIESLLNPEINASWDYALRRAQAAIRAGKP